MTSLKTLAGTLLLVALSACDSSGVPLPATQTPEPSPPIVVAPAPTTPAATEPKLLEYTVDDTVINESSGLARSNLRDDILWTLNDSGGATELYAITTGGRHVATLSITGAPANLDWEDLASYTRNGVSYLLIGDMGDNNAFRPALQFYVVKEPSFTPGSTVQALSVVPDSIVNAIYPTGPRDAESLAVDPVENMAYIVSKRDAMPTLYRFSLAAVGSPLMQNLGAINIPRAPADFVGNVDSFNWTTAMDFDDTLSRVYVGSLLNGYFWDRPAGQTWAQAFANPPSSAFALPKYSQIEAGTFVRGRKNAVFITSEGAPAPLARIIP